MARIIPHSRPKMSRENISRILSHTVPPNELNPNLAYIVGIRGYYLNTMGKRGENDINVYDDAAFVISPDEFHSYNANTDPSFVKRKGRFLAKINLGVYTFYRDYHLRSRGKSKMYEALRMYPEGVWIACTRNGKPSTCGFINFHYGSNRPQNWVTWSDGCQTIPKTQYRGTSRDFKEVVWRLMTALPHPKGCRTVTGRPHKLIQYSLVENLEIQGKQRIVDRSGKIIDLDY